MRFTATCENGLPLRVVWQTWGNLQVTDNGSDSHHFFGFFGGNSQVSTTTPTWTESDGAAVGSTSTDTWDTSVTHNPTYDWHSNVGSDIPWAADNPWHAPSEYGYSSEFFAPGFAFGTAGQDSGDGLAWQSLTTVFASGDVQLQHTIRVVSPYEPGSINWYLDRPNSGVVTGPSGAAVPQTPVPEPATVALSGVGLLALGLLAWRKKRV